MLCTRFKRQGNDEDLDQATALDREALLLFLVDHTDQSMPLHGLADEDLDKAIALEREVLDLHPVGHPSWYMSLGNLAADLFIHFEHQGNNEDLDEAIALQRESLNNLATYLSTRLDQQGNALALHPVGNAEDLDDTISLGREALALLPIGHTDRSKSLNNLALQLSDCFDLDDAISLGREALAFLPISHTGNGGDLDESIALHREAHIHCRLSTRFHQRGSGGDLDEAIALQREALTLHPLLNNLALQLSNYLDEAIALDREALALLPIGHTDQSSSLNNLVNRLSDRFDHQGNAEDLGDAITLGREALALRPVGHTGWSSLLNNLDEDLDEAIALDREALALYNVSNAEDLDESIALHMEVLALRPVSHTDQTMSLCNLTTQLSTHFDHQGHIEDLNKSQEYLCCALTLLTQHDPHQLEVHISLVVVYLSFHRSGLDGTVSGESTDGLNAAMHHFKAAAHVVSGSLLHHLQASLRWIHHASQYSHGTELEAYATSMQLLDTYMSVTASVSSRHNTMKEFPITLAVDAASCALRSGDVHHAVELLEQGRTLIWTQMTRLHTPLDSLQTCGNHAVALMKRFRDLISLLDKPPASHPEGTPRVDVEAEETQYRRLVEDWNGVIEEIWKIEGFSRFLLPPLFSDLQDAARDGPIIVLITSKSSCNAIIIPHKQLPTSIKLPTNLEKLQTLVDKLQCTSGEALTKALVELWDNVVRLVVKNLNIFAPQGSRIWWYPMSVFNFLLLHAAGKYRKHGQFLSQLYISSYTPSLTALIKAHRHDRSLSVSFAPIGQNHPAGASFTLDSVEPELELVQSLLPPSPTVSFIKITSVDATRSRALHTLQENTWLHFVCHGTQKYEDPFNSAFLMCDQPLSLLDITQTDLSQHEFAFLSACETAVSDHDTPDEVIHLAAGLQFTGVKSVIGTLWEVNNSTVQRLVEAFYKNFCGDDKMNSKQAAQALHRAVQLLACDKDMPLDQRIVFIHIGI
ncbi:TPR-like protein [Suillus subluteus]|nr:TPR-like protein [Suillus subluteus]